MRSRRHRAITRAKLAEMHRQNFAGYIVLLRGGVARLTPKQESMIWDVALLANDYERLRRYIH